MTDTSALNTAASEGSTQSNGPLAPSSAKGKAKSKNLPGVYTLPPSAHQAFRYAAVITSFENEGNEKEKTTAEDILIEAVTRHLVQLQKEGIRFPDKMVSELIKAKLLKA